jgi:hypothetical protein
MRSTRSTLHVHYARRIVTLASRWSSWYSCAASYLWASLSYRYLVTAWHERWTRWTTALLHAPQHRASTTTVLSVPPMVTFELFHTQHRSMCASNNHNSIHDNASCSWAHYKYLFEREREYLMSWIKFQTFWRKAPYVNHSFHDATYHTRSYTYSNGASGLRDRPHLWPVAFTAKCLLSNLETWMNDLINTLT